MTTLKLRLGKKRAPKKGVFNRERALITKIVEDGDMHSVAKAHVTEEFFAVPEMREVFSWLTSQYERFGRVPSMDVLKDEFIDFDPEHVSDDMELLIHRVKGRKLYADLQAMMTKATQLSREDPEKALESMYDAVSRLSIEHSSTEDIDVSKAADDVWQAYLEAKELKGVLGLPYPWERVNKATRGIQPAQFVAIYGPSGVMKTWLLIYISYFVAVQTKKPVIFVTFEMPAEDILHRLAAIHAGLDYEEFQDGGLSRHDEKKFRKSLKRMRRLPFYIVELEETGQAAIVSLQAKIEEYNAALLCIDGLSFLVEDNEWGSFSDITKGLKAFAKSKKRNPNRTPILATHHANRNRKKTAAKSVETDDVALGDTLHRFCDVLFRLDRQQEHVENEEIVLVSKKVRNGKGVSITVNAKPAYDFAQKFVDDATGGGSKDGDSEDEGSIVE